MNKKTLSLIQFIVGLILTLTSVVFMFLGIFPLATRITIGIIGLLLIATSTFRLIKI